MSHWITLVTPHGRMNGWIAEPDDKPNGGVVLVPDVFGVNAGVQETAARYAREGYLTLVPALFDKLQREVELDSTPENEDYGSALAARLGLEVAAELTSVAVDAIGHAGKVAIIGHGWGGTVALQSARALELPLVDYYGPYQALPGQAPTPIPALLHHGENDPRFGPEADGLFRAALPQLQVFGYPTGQAFDRVGDAAHFDARRSELALQRTLDFLRTHIRHEND